MVDCVSIPPRRPRDPDRRVRGAATPLVAPRTHSPDESDDTDTDQEVVETKVVGAPAKKRGRPPKTVAETQD